MKQKPLTKNRILILFEKCMRYAYGRVCVRVWMCACVRVCVCACVWRELKNNPCELFTPLYGNYPYYTWWMD